MDEQRVRKIVREEPTKAVSVRDVLRRDGEMNVDGGAALGAAVCGFTPIARRSSHWTLLQKALLTALIAVCAKPMRCFVSLHGFLWRIYESTRSHLAKFILLLLCAPCFKLSYLFFKLTYALQERRSAAEKAGREAREKVLAGGAA